MAGFFWIDNKLGVEALWLYQEAKVMSYAQYKVLGSRYPHVKWLRAGGGVAHTAVIEYSTLPERYKELVEQKLGCCPLQKYKRTWVTDTIEWDTQAEAFYAAYIMPDGRRLSDTDIRCYTATASVLNALRQVVCDRKMLQKAAGITGARLWERLNMEIALIDTRKYPHNLPTNIRALQRKLEKYGNKNYETIIHGNHLKKNRLKVSEQLERLIVSLYCMPHKHFVGTITELYLQFVSGVIDVADVETGEIFDRNCFIKNGVPVEISNSTAWNWLNKPHNALIIKKYRGSSIDFATKQIPHTHRHVPFYSLSKVSFDDRVLPRPMIGGGRVYAYYAYDVASECFLAAAYSTTNKDVALVMDCFRTLYRTLTTNGLPWPMEAEVERHLMSSIEDTVNAIFPHVRWCNPQNSREKRAEHGIKQKKYGTEKAMQENIGRWYAAIDAYRTNPDADRQYDANLLITDDQASITAHNHKPHSKHKTKTRWQVLMETVNPAAHMIHNKIVRHIGTCTETSIRYNDYVRVQHADYAIDANILNRLEPNNLSVQAYWIADADGQIGRVYLYQDEQFLCECAKIQKYNEALAEMTDADKTIYTEQTKRAAHIRKIVKDGARDKVRKLAILQPVADVEYAETVDMIVPQASNTAVPIDDWEALAEMYKGGVHTL
ncbi:MAG: hypothetical protein SNJ71_00025 [Bacteroidales bacterium]